METLINFEKDVLMEYGLWADSNPKNWNILSYLNQLYDLNAAIAFSKLYFPNFINIQGCVVLDFRYDEKTFKDWFSAFDESITKTERMCNLYEVKDFFHINQPTYASDEEYNKAIDLFASILKTSWKLNLKALYPNKVYKVEVFEEYDTTKITLYSI